MANLGAKGGFAVTPLKVSVCTLLKLCHPADDDHSLSLDIFQRQLISSFLLRFCTNSSSFLEPSLEELVSQLRVAQEEVQVDLIGYLLHHLEKLSSPNDLVDLFVNLRDILPRPLGEESDISNLEGNDKKLNPNSILGRFVRRCILSFNSSCFEEICRLFANLKCYCSRYIKFDEPLFSESELISRTQNHITSNFGDDDLTFEDPVSGRHRSKSIEIGKQGRGKCGLLASQSDHEDVQGNRKDERFLFLRSHSQVESYLRGKADLIEKQVALVPMNMFNRELEKLKELAPYFNRVYYLQYLNSLYHGDYQAALYNFHKFFDYSAGKEGIENNGMFSTGRFQAVLLSMGTMHSLFGHPAHALVALTEGINQAQQASDNYCLAHILAALCYLFSEVGISSNSDSSDSGISSAIDIGAGSYLAVQEQLPILLKRCLSRAVELKLTHLVLLSRLALAKFDLKHVQRSPLSIGLKVSTKLSTEPVDVCKNLRLSCYALSESGIDPMCAVTGAPLSDLSLSSLRKPRGLYLQMGDASRFHGPIPRANMQLSGKSFLLRSMAWEMYGSAPLVRLNALIHAICYADAASTEELSLAYVKLIQQLAIFKGYQEAFAALDLIERKLSSFSKPQIQLLKLQLTHDQALHRGELRLAQHVCNQLAALASPVSGVDADLKIEATLRHSRTLLAAQQFGEAVSVAQSLFCTSYKFNMQVENTRVLLLLAEIHKKSGNPVAGLPYVLACLSLCQCFNLDLLRATAMLSLAELWLCLGSGHAKHALALLHQGLPVILGHGGLELRARANLATAKCYLAIPDFSVSDEANTVLDPLRKAAKEFEVLEYHELASEAFYLIAIIFNSLGNKHERDNAAAAFQKHVEAQNHSQRKELVMPKL